MKPTGNIEAYLREINPNRANDWMKGIADLLDLRDPEIPDEVYDTLTRVACSKEFGTRPVRALMLLSTIAARDVLRARDAMGRIALCAENVLLQRSAVSLIGKGRLICQIGCLMILASGHPAHHAVQDVAIPVLAQILDAELADA